MGVRAAMFLSVVPGLLAAAAISYAIRKRRPPVATERRRLRFQVHPVLRGRLGRVMLGFEVVNIAATLLILRATDLVAPTHGTDTATQLAIGLYVLYNVAATVVSSPPAASLTDEAHCP